MDLTENFPTRLTRRSLLSGIMSVVALSSSSTLARNILKQNRQTDCLESGEEYWISAQGKNKECYGLSWTSGQATELKTALSGFRGHGVCMHPKFKNSVIFFGRRPSRIGLQINLKTGQLENQFECQAGSHLFGHGCFSQDGKYLFSSETDLSSGMGKIAVRDSMSLRQIDRLESFGIGPHEIKLMPDGKQLVIANGGILTHPDSGRKKLNLSEMASSLTYLDLKTGKLLEQISVEEAKASIRHLDVANDGTVVIAMQIQRNACGHNRIVSLGGAHQLNGELKMFDKPKMLVNQMEDYAGSVAINNESRLAGLASPKGNLVGFWNIDSATFAGYHKLSDVCGITVTKDNQFFVISSSVGQLRFLHKHSLEEDKDRRITLKNTHWDNHLISALL